MCFLDPCSIDPYPDLTPGETAARVAQETNPLRLATPKKMAKKVRRIFKKCFELDPADRPTFDEIWVDLEELDSLFARKKSKKEEEDSP